ncbi:MAG TPA: uroporphyrinogen decarboxylase family protein [Candidatus Aquicultoraceae bacterium]|nr:uroporphyrinogen decarboxylase family protein [Candidatus Aquicultoraceae bacterium]
MGNAPGDKIELVDRVLSGGAGDRPPVSLWYHFGVQHGDGARFARLAVDCFRHYDFDFLKVMNDYYYPMPEGIDAVRTAEDLRRISRFDVGKSPWAEQFRALEIIAGELEGEAHFLDTVFDPWHTLKRSLAGENLEGLMANEPEAVLEALGAIAENLIAYCRRSLAIGTAGIFLSVPAARELVSMETFLTFVKPFALRVLEAVAGAGRMHVAHLHGDDLFFDDCLDFPVQAFNWWDRGPGGPSLQAVKERISACVMGGIDHKIVNRKTAPFLADHVMEARRLGGRERFFLANGCSIDASVNPRAIRAIVEAARAPA